MWCVKQAWLVAGAAAVCACSGCRQEPPPPPYNYNLADAGERPLLPPPEPLYDPALRGPVRRADQQAGAATGEAVRPAVSGLPAGPGSEEILRPIQRFNELTAEGEYEQIAELLVPEQREQSLRYWQAFSETVLALNDAVEAATETAGSAQPELLPRIEAVRSRIGAVAGRTLVVQAVRLDDGEGAVAIEPPPVRCLSAADVPEISLRRVEGQWLVTIRQLPDEAGLDQWVNELQEIGEAADEAISAFEDTEIGLAGLVERLEGLAQRMESGPVEPAAEEPPEQPPAAPPDAAGEGLS